MSTFNGPPCGHTILGTCPGCGGREFMREYLGEWLPEGRRDQDRDRVLRMQDIPLGSDVLPAAQTAPAAPSPPLPTIHTSTSFSKLFEMTGVNPRALMPAGLGDRIAKAAVDEGARLGLFLQPEQAQGRYLVVAGANLKRQTLYALAPLGREEQAARELVGAIAGAHGPGRWWSLGNAVHAITDDGMARYCTVGGEPYIWLRAIYCHEAMPEKFQPAPEIQAPAHDPLDVEYDGVPLRDLLDLRECVNREQDLGAGTECSIPWRNADPWTWTPAQRAAVSAHWSAQLRAKVRASDAADKARAPSVVIDVDAEDLLW